MVPRQAFRDFMAYLINIYNIRLLNSQGTEKFVWDKEFEKESLFIVKGTGN